MSIKHSASRYTDALRVHRERNARIKFKLLFILTCGAIGVMVWWLFWSGSFTVTNIQITGGSESIRQSSLFALNQWLDARPWFTPRRANSLLFNPTNASATIATAVPKLAAVSVRRVSFHDVTISIAERTQAGIWCKGNAQCF